MLSGEQKLQSLISVEMGFYTTKLWNSRCLFLDPPVLGSVVHSKKWNACQLLSQSCEFPTNTEIQPSTTAVMKQQEMDVAILKRPSLCQKDPPLVRKGAGNKTVNIRMRLAKFTE